MAIIPVGSVVGFQENNNNIILAFPGGVLEDDFVVVTWGNAKTTDQAMTVVTSGYSERANLFASDSNDHNFAVHTKFMGVTPDTEVEVTGSISGAVWSTAVAQIWRGVDLSNPMDVAPTTAQDVNSDIPDPPSITPITPNSLILACGGTSLGESAPTIVAPAGYTNLSSIFADDAAGFWSASMMASKIKIDPGAEDPAAFGGFGTATATESWCACTLALRPALYVPPSWPRRNWRHG